MLAKSNGIGGDGILTSPFSLGGFGDVFGAVSSAAGGPVTSAGNNATTNMNPDGLLVTGTSSSKIINADSIITFSPVKDAELRRRARNNQILAKIQELEANATVQAARSERLRMMREEYEGLVRKYAGNGKWTWGQGASSSNRGFMNENHSAYRQAAYLARYGPQQQQPFMFGSSSGNNPSALQQELLTTTTGTSMDNGNFHAGNKATSMYEGNTVTRSLATIGVNTEITGPVIQQNDSEEGQRSSSSYLKRVKVVVDSGSQTEVPAAEDSEKVIASDKGANQSGSVMTGEEVKPGAGGGNSSSSNVIIKRNRNLPTNMEMMMLLEDEDDESLLEAHERSKLQREELHRQLKQPRGAPTPMMMRMIPSEENSSPSSSPVGEQAAAPSTSNTTEEVLELRRRREQGNQNQQQLQKRKTESGRIYSKKTGRDGEDHDETSGDSTTASLVVAGRRGHGGEMLSKGMMLRSELADLSISDSNNSVFQIQKHQLQRKKLMEELQARTNMRGKSSTKADDHDDDDMGEGTTINDSDDDDDDETKPKSEMESELLSPGAAAAVEENDGKEENGGNLNEDEMIQQCSSPVTAGATSESIGDSVMDSIQKTPDTLPRDDSELRGIAEEEDNEEEIELDNAAEDEEDDDEVLVVEAPFPGSLAGNEERLSNGGREIWGGKEEIKELVAHRHHLLDEEEDEINEPEEIRSSNLSSSSKKLEVLVEEENNPGESRGNNFLIQNQDEREPVKIVPSPFHNEDDMFQVKEEEKVDENAEKILLQSDTDGVNEAEGKNKIYSYYAPASSSNANSNSNVFLITDGEAVETEGENSSVLPPAALESPSTIPPAVAGQLSTGSSSSSASSRQQSLEEHGGGGGDDAGNANNKAIIIPKTMEGKGSEEDRAKTKEQTSFPQAVNNDKAPQKQIIKKGGGGGNKKTAPLQGGDMTPERLTSYPKSSSSEHGGSGKEKGMSLEKATKTSSFPATSSSGKNKGTFGGGGGESPSSAADNALNLNGNSIIPPHNNVSKTVKTTSGSSPPKPMQLGVGPTTKPSGITSASNTAKRFRLKFNYDDSESDSSEIGPVKTNSVGGGGAGQQPGSQQTGSVTGGGKANSRSQQQQPNANGNNVNMGGSNIKVEMNETDKDKAKKQDERDDDFDDFFDI